MWFAILVEAVEAILESTAYWADVAVLLVRALRRHLSVHVLPAAGKLRETHAEELARRRNVDRLSGGLWEAPQLLQLVNVFVGWSEELKAGNAVAALKQTLKPEATVKRDGVWRNIPVGTINQTPHHLETNRSS